MTCRRAHLSRLQSQIVQSYEHCRCGPSQLAKHKSPPKENKRKLTRDKPGPSGSHATMMCAVKTHSRVLVLTADKGQGLLPVQLVFDDTSFTFKDSSTSTWASYSLYFSLPHVQLTPQAHLMFMFP